MTIACIRIPHFSLRVELLDRPELDGAPLVLRSPAGGRATVVDCTPEALQRAIRPGMSVREVSALCPEAVVIYPNPVRDTAVFEQIVTRLEAISPLVESEEPGICYVDLRGLSRHYGSTAALIARLLQVVPSILRPRVGVAPGRFTARVAAEQAAPGGSLVVAAEDVTSFLDGLPVIHLPLPGDVIRRLEQLGLRTLGELAALPVSAVQARFGPDGRHAWELAHGRDDDRVQPRQHEPIVFEQLRLPAPATSRETLMVAVRQLVIRAFGRSALQHRSVRQARLRALIEDGRSWEHVVTLREPVGGTRLIEVLHHRLQAIELPGPLEALTLELSGLVAEVARQESLLGARPRRTRQLIEAIRQLKQRYGVSPIYRVMEVEPWSRIPERRRALISYDP